MVKCEYCGEEIRAARAKFDEVGRVYLHDGDSHVDLDRKLRREGFHNGLIGVHIPASVSEGAIAYQRTMPHDSRLCAQLYKATRAVLGESALLGVVELPETPGV